jgi:hypothetical protein
MPATTATATTTATLLDRVIASLPAQAGADLAFDLACGEGEPRQFTVTRKGELITFESRLTDAQARTLLQGVRGDFASSLASRRVWSASQQAWAHKLATDAQQPQQAAPVAAAGPSPFEALFQAFEAAASGKGGKRLAIRLPGVTLKPSKDGQALWATDPSRMEEGRFGLQPAFMGAVRRSGLDARIPAAAAEAILTAAADPLAAAVAFGRETGSCSCCGRELTVKASIERGIGPICAEKFGW